jgi:hypothetical protein
MNQYLIRYLENAGARVYATKERDHNPSMAIVDDGGAGYAESGSGFEDGPSGFAEAGPWAYGENPFEAGSTRRFPADEGAVATWIPEVPQDGIFAVYVSWDSDPDNSAAAHYKITHPGGTIHRRFDQRVHGSTWQYVETMWLPGGVEGLTVELIADGEAGTWLSADAVRIGGGMGDVSRHGETSGRPRHEEGAVLHNQFNGAPISVYDPYGDGNGSDPSTRSRWAAWEHPIGEDAIYLSWHSNAFDGTARGTVTYHYEGDYTPVTGSSALAESVQDAMMDAILTTWDADWYDRGVKTAAFSELSPYHNDEMPAALVELAFHDNELDAWYLKEPTFRRDMSRAMAHGIVRYFAERDGVVPAYLPEPPTALVVRHRDDGALWAEWAPGPSGGVYGDPASSYRVYRSSDGRAWDSGTEVGEAEMELDAAPGEQIFVRVAALSSGGASFPTETLGARRSADGWAPVLLVSAFDRLSGSNLIWEDIPTLGAVVRMPLERVNGFDTTVSAGRAITGAGYYFDSVSDEAFGELDLSGYSLVIWSAGQESTEDETLSAAQQDAVRSFVSDGGRLWATGSEILWDLDRMGDASDQAFAAEVLGAGLESDDAGTSVATGQALLKDLILDFAEADGAPYPVGYPDVLATEGKIIATYGDGRPAGVLHERVALFGFPFECIGDADVRYEVMARMLPRLMPDYVPPEDGDADGGLAEDTGGATGALPPLDDVPTKGCACATQASPVSLLGLLGLLGLRRRQ